MGSVLLPIINLCRQDYILCEVRSEFIAQPGEICLPGGHAIEGETPEETAIRETIEELSIPAEYIHLTGETFASELSSGIILHTVVANVDRQALASIVRDEHEVAGWFLLPINWLRNRPANVYSYSNPEIMPEGLQKYLEGYSSPLEGSTLCWDYEGRIIWGLTARIIDRFIREFRPKA